MGSHRPGGRVDGRQVSKSPANPEPLAYLQRWLSLSCSCLITYVNTTLLGMFTTISYCQIPLRAGGRAGVWKQVLPPESYLHDTLGLPAPAALLRSTGPPKQSLFPSGFDLADSTHLERYTSRWWNLSPPLLPSLTPTLIKAVCFIFLRCLPSQAEAPQYPLLTSLFCMRKNWTILKE